MTVLLTPPVMAQRKQWRQECLGMRMNIKPSLREEYDKTIFITLKTLLLPRTGILGFAYPIQGEYDMRPLINTWLGMNKNCRSALPVVLGKGEPLRFREWTPTSTMRTAGFGTQIPETGEWLQPDILLIPLVGYDNNGYRLGYGGGYYDRTLANWHPSPLKIGVGYSICALDSIFPAEHDVRMDWIVTEKNTLSFL